MRENTERRLILTMVAFVLLPTTLLVVGLWGDGIRPSLFDLSEVSVVPGAAIAALGIVMGTIFAALAANRSDGGTILSGSGPEGDFRSVRTLVGGFALVSVVGALAGAIAAYAGSFNTYSILLWICALYGVAVVSLYDLDRQQRAAIE